MGKGVRGGWMTGKKKKLYQCADCKLWYEDKEWADRCFEWCTAHHTCSLAITRHAIRD